MHFSRFVPVVALSAVIVFQAGVASHWRGTGIVSARTLLPVSDGNDWPDATNTGMPAGTVPTIYTGPNVITVAGTVIENKIINTYIEVRAKSVTIRNSRIDFDGWHPIYAYEGADGLTVERCTITGQGKTGGSYGIDTSDISGSTLIGNNIAGYENGITPGSNAVIKGNYIHDLQAGGADPHYDGIQLGGHPKVQANVLIENNTIIGRDNADVWITNDFGSINGIKVNHNQLLGKASGTGPNVSLPVFTVYVDGAKPNGTISGITITNNVIQRGVYGFIDIDSASNVTGSGNVDPFDSPI
ncbi:right-handed parallel beta-helix repeat-containing protein [Mesorhizobium sp. B2-9-1]|nr:right-handed parallel beta-helix repeat-containing protein [Mesorhizobium sp. B2-9-1]TPJ31669.1 right-handed parallel beta-helix repeat-containing protein [Mesorhizobium sp. B2-7-2]